MTLLLFLVLYAAKHLNSPNNTYVAVLCYGLDQLFWISVYRVVLYRRGNPP